MERWPERIQSQPDYTMTSIVKSRSLECGGLAPLWSLIALRQPMESFAEDRQLVLEDRPQIEQHFSFGNTADDRR